MEYAQMTIPELEERESSIKTKHPEYMPEESPEQIPEKPGVLHKKRFPKCIYESGTDCIGEDCDTCQKKAEWKKTEKRDY